MRPGNIGLVILDPPVMGRAHGRTFSLAQQLDELLVGVVRKLTAGGILVFSTHARRWTMELLRSHVDEAAKTHGRAVRWIAERGLPEWDHPVNESSEGLDRGDYLKTLVLEFA